MAEAAVPEPLLRGLPDQIVVWEILVRLPPKPLLRSRAVSPAWRRATSSRDFLLAHHARQPSLPIFEGKDNIVAFDRPQLDDIFLPEASCDGLLIYAYGYWIKQYSICNPATHQYAPLMQLRGFNLLGMYPHDPTGEYRLLLRKLSGLAPDDQFASYVFTLGSDQSPRDIGYAQAQEMICTSSVLFGGNLHWPIEQNLSESEIPSNLIMVFDTTAELFRQMQAPAVPGYADLFEMGDMLGMASFNSANTIIVIWVMQDYESEAWTYKFRIELLEPGAPDAAS